MSVESIKTLQVLWLRGADPNQPALADLLGSDCQVDFVDSVDEAVQALKRGSFDLVISGSEDLSPRTSARHHRCRSSR